MTITIKKLHLAIAVMAVAALVPATAFATHVFTDVDDARFYAEPVTWAAANGITTGTSETTFDPDRPVTRGESVTFLKRYHDAFGSVPGPQGEQGPAGEPGTPGPTIAHLRVFPISGGAVAECSWEPLGGCGGVVLSDLAGRVTTVDPSNYPDSASFRLDVRSGIGALVPADAEVCYRLVDALDLSVVTGSESCLIHDGVSGSKRSLSSNFDFPAGENDYLLEANVVNAVDNLGVNYAGATIIVDW